MGVRSFFSREEEPKMSDPNSQLILCVADKLWGHEEFHSPSEMSFFIYKPFLQVSNQVKTPPLPIPIHHHYRERSLLA